MYYNISNPKDYLFPESKSDENNDYLLANNFDDSKNSDDAKDFHENLLYVEESSDESEETDSTNSDEFVMIDQ